MADRKISDLTALTTPASGDYVPIVDISEAAAASKNKRVTIQSLFQGIPVNVGIGTSSPATLLHVSGASSTVATLGTSSTDVYLRFQNSVNTGGYIGYNSSALTFWTADAERLRLTDAGNVGIGTTIPTTLLDVASNTVRVRTARTPASASATGATGEICWDANYIYVCTATNTWKRSALSTW